MLNLSVCLKTTSNLHNPSTLIPVKLLLNLSFCQALLASSSMSSSKIVAEYAKSGRSSCKKCSKPIASSALRLGLVSKDPRGFDMTKWHHLNCFPFTNSEFTSSAESITGFSSLKSSDQESVKKLLEEGTSKKVHKTDQMEDCDSEQGNVKKLKLSASEEGENLELEIAVSVSDIKDNYKGALLPPKWKAFQTIIFLERDDGLHDSKKIAAFDFDGCLAKTSVKRIGADAWSLMYPSIPDKLQNLYNDGYKLVIFTNESNIERWKNKRQVAVDSKIGRLEGFIKLVKVPIQVFIASGLSSGQPEDPFRKPKPGMWRIMEKEFNSGLPVDLDQSFYVGDAAGRPDDHSDADLKFAQAIGLKFYVPEEYFTSSGVALAHIVPSTVVSQDSSPADHDLVVASEPLVNVLLPASSGLTAQEKRPTLLINSFPDLADRPDSPEVSPSAEAITYIAPVAEVLPAVTLLDSIASAIPAVRLAPVSNLVDFPRPLRQDTLSPAVPNQASMRETIAKITELMNQPLDLVADQLEHLSSLLYRVGAFPGVMACSAIQSAVFTIASRVDGIRWAYPAAVAQLDVFKGNLRAAETVARQHQELEDRLAESYNGLNEVRDKIHKLHTREVELVRELEQIESEKRRLANDFPNADSAAQDRDGAPSN